MKMLRIAAIVVLATNATPAAAAPVTITALPASADALLLPGARLATIGFAPLRPPRVDPKDKVAVVAAKRIYHARQLSERAALLRTVREAAAAAPDEPDAQAILGEAEAKLGDRAGGIRVLDAGLARAPKDAQLLYVRGIVELEQARALTGDAAVAARKRARAWLARANAARPGDYRILAAYAAGFGTDLPDNALEVLLRAVDLAPRVASVQALAALALARRGDRVRAKAQLAPIAASPHGGEASTAATALIAAIERGETPAEVPEGLSR